MDFDDEDIFGMPSEKHEKHEKKEEGWGVDVEREKLAENSLDAALDVILDGEKREKKIKNAHQHKCDGKFELDAAAVERARKLVSQAKKKQRKQKKKKTT